MAVEIFGSVVDPSISVGTKQWYTVPLSILAHTVGLAALIVVPLMAGALPTPESVLVFAVTPAPPPSPPPPEPTNAPPVVTPAMPLNRDAAPVEAPSQVIAEPLPQSFAPIRGVPGGVPGGLPTASVGLSTPPEAAPPAFVRPGGNIKDPRKIVDARPVYPAMAIAARAEGVVILEAIISRDGDVIDAKVVRSQPLLDRAALDAVKQWKFTPTTLNGVPVEVHMMVTVNFTLH